MTKIETINKIVSGLCDHDFQSLGIIDSERDFYGEKYLVLYECLNCKKQFQEWTREK